MEDTSSSAWASNFRAQRPILVFQFHRIRQKITVRIWRILHQELEPFNLSFNARFWLSIWRILHPRILHWVLSNAFSAFNTRFLSFISNFPSLTPHSSFQSVIFHPHRLIYSLARLDIDNEVSSRLNNTPWARTSLINWYIDNGFLGSLRILRISSDYSTYRRWAVRNRVARSHI